MLTDLLAGQCKPSEKIFIIVHISILDALNGITEIEVLNGGKLNNTLRSLKT